jgi:Arc/MetJ family transcription regulator
MAKHLVDIDDDALGAARAELGTESIKETVNEALRRVSRGRRKGVARAIDVLIRAKLEDRDRGRHKRTHTPWRAYGPGGA